MDPGKAREEHHRERPDRGVGGGSQGGECRASRRPLGRVEAAQGWGRGWGTESTPNTPKWQRGLGTASDDGFVSCPKATPPHASP